MVKGMPDGVASNVDPQIGQNKPQPWSQEHESNEEVYWLKVGCLGLRSHTQQQAILGL